MVINVWSGPPDRNRDVIGELWLTEESLLHFFSRLMPFLIDKIILWKPNRHKEIRFIGVGGDVWKYPFNVDWGRGPWKFLTVPVKLHYKQLRFWECLYITLLLSCLLTGHVFTQTASEVMKYFCPYKRLVWSANPHKCDMSWQCDVTCVH